MNPIKNAKRLSEIYEQLKRNKIEDSTRGNTSLPGGVWFIGDNEVLCEPRNDGDSRYPYGSEGFNFWVYSSGYIHSNEGVFSPFLRSIEGQEPKICWFASVKTQVGEKRFSLLSVPETLDEAERFTVFNPAYVTFVTVACALRFSVRCYVTAARETRFTLSVENLEKTACEVKIFSYYNPFLLHDVFENGENRWFREVRVVDNGVLIPDFSVRCSENLSRTRQVSNFGVFTRSLTLENNAKLVKSEETSSRNAFVGGFRSSLHNPISLRNGTFGEERHVTTFTEVGACGSMLTLELPAGGSARKDTSFRFARHQDDDAIEKSFLSDRPSAERFDGELLAIVNADKTAHDDSFTLSFKDSRGENSGKNSAALLNGFFAHLKRQVAFCASIKGYVQPGGGSLIGIRDVFQAIEGHILWQPEQARAKMLEALSFTDPSGRCPRQYSLPAREGAVPAMDLRPFIDQGVWVISTIVSYLKLTGDFAFLSEQCGYYEILDEGKRLVQKSDKIDSVLDHMLAIMSWMLDKTDEETGCIRVLFGDWNDALDGLGVSHDPDKQYGSGVSVMAAAQVWQNLNEMQNLLAMIDSAKFADVIADYSARAERLAEGLYKHGVVYNDCGKARISHGWGDKLSYYVGGWNDPDGLERRSLTSNAFWFLTGLSELDAEGEISKTALEDMKQLTSKYGLKTFDPAFAPGVKGVGRIPKLPEGTAENGAAYIHASAFGIMALFKIGEAERAWEELYKILPFTHDTVSISPFVMPNSYGLNPGKNIDGESMMDWQTGSSNVVLKLLARYVMGVETAFDGVYIAPAAYCPFDSFNASLNIRKAKLKLEYACGDGSTGANRTFIINGEAVKGEYSPSIKTDRLFIPLEKLSGEIAIKVIDN